MTRSTPTRSSRLRKTFSFSISRLARSPASSSVGIVATFQKNWWFNAYPVFNYVQDAGACSRGTAYVHSAIADGKISPSIDRIFPMEGYVDAWHYMMGERTSRGKVVIDTTF